MQLLEVSDAVRHILMSLGGKGLRTCNTFNCAFLCLLLANSTLIYSAFGKSLCTYNSCWN
jgi:hypothetical protein